MSERQLAEINSTLSDPPLFDLSGSDQLGLFIAGQLGKRHDVKVTLRSSAYGGVTAVVLIPTELVIDVPELEDDFAIAGIRELGGRPVPQLPGVASDPALTLAATVSTTSSQAHVIDLDTRVVSSEPPDVTDEPAALPAPAAAQEPGVWSAPAAVAADATVAQHLPTREPGTTGLTRGENGLAGGMWPGTPAEQPAARHADVAAEAGAAQADSADLDGLPVRVRQANLAPQLRTASTPMATAADEPAAGPSPEAARNTMAALQRGWQRGRSMTEPTDGEFRTSPSPQRSGDPPDEGEQE